MSLGAESSGMVVSTVQVSVRDGEGGAGGGEVRKAVAAGASGAGGAERKAGERMPAGPVARRSLAWAVSSCGLEWDAPERRAAGNYSPRTVSRIFSASIAAV